MEFEKQYHWCNIYNTKKFDLTYEYEQGKCYRVATYSTKTKKIILYNPKEHIPSTENLQKFVELCENYKFER